MSNSKEIIETGDILKLIVQIFECIEPDDKTKEPPQITIYSDDCLVLEIENKRFRVSIQDTSQFQ